MLIRCGPDTIEDSGIHIYQGNWSFTDLPAWNLGSGHDHRYADTPLVHGGFIKQTMLAHRVAMVGRIEHSGRVLQSGRAQSREHEADLVVQERAHAEVGPQCVHAHRPWNLFHMAITAVIVQDRVVRPQSFIAFDRIAQHVKRIHVVILTGYGQREMGRDKADIEDERFFLARSLVVQEFGG